MCYDNQNLSVNVLITFLVQLAGRKHDHYFQSYLELLATVLICPLTVLADAQNYY